MVRVIKDLSVYTMNRSLKLYLDSLVSVLIDELNGMLHSVVLFGSAAYGAYEPVLSDVDVQAVIVKSLEPQVYRNLAAKLSHTSIPCPARKLEFVLYTKENAARKSQNPQYELNLNTGKDMDDYLGLHSTEDRHWFLLDIASGIDLGIALYGPEPKEVFAHPRLDWIFESLLDSISWHVKNEATSPNSILNACRGLRFAETGHWGSKAEGIAWAIERHSDNYPVLVETNDARRHNGLLAMEGALEFLMFTENEIKRLRSEKIPDDVSQQTPC